jgi:hypothetical protein
MTSDEAPGACDNHKITHLIHSPSVSSQVENMERRLPAAQFTLRPSSH